MLTGPAAATVGWPFVGGAQQTARTPRVVLVASQLPSKPTVFDLVVSPKIAKAIGITIPDSFLLQATQVIE